MELEELRKVKPAILFTVEPQRGFCKFFVTFGYIGDAHWAGLGWP